MPDRTALVRCDDAAVAGAVAGRLRADGLRVTVVPASAPPERAVADVVGDSSALDVLVCAMGQPAPAPFVGADPARWYAEVMAHLTPAFALVRAAAPALRRSGAGRLAFLGSGWTADTPDATAAAVASGVRSSRWPRPSPATSGRTRSRSTSWSPTPPPRRPPSSSPPRRPT
jgi:NAD(P)-dependent dehydrogenase (short-subunit alcohol dehydrogenase family)